METQLFRVGDGLQRWYIGKTLLANEQPLDLGDGWTVTVYTEGSRNEVEVLLNGQQQYWCNISRANVVWLFEKGAATLTKEDPAHKALAKFALDALADRQAGTILVGATILAPGKTINGKTYRTRMGSHNHFTDGNARRISGPYGRIKMKCVGGTYLVAVHRHVDHDIFAVEITAEPNYNRDHLRQCLMHDLA